MGKFEKTLIGIFITACVTTICFTFLNKTYSYGASSYITGSSGSYVLQFYDIDTGVDISCSAAQTYYGATKYQRKKLNGSYVYFYNCEQTTKSKYDVGYPKEIADIRAKNKGDSAIRVTDTASAKKAYDSLYQNHRTGTFTLEFAENETIDWEAVEDYVLTKYGVTNYKTNYYKYDVKGEWEPIRYGLPDKSNTSSGTVEVDMWRMRITGDELKVTEAFVNKLIPILESGDGSDYQKILAAYQYLKQFTTYLVDDGFSNGVASNTSVYDAFIERQTTCIGYSIAFSYLMDKMGIESYIVDQITSNDASTESFASVHTYNIVKLDGKFYKLDLTGGAFLTGISSSTLSDSKLTISTSAYNTSGKKTSWSFDKTTINNYLSSAKSTKTTTTNKIYLTTTTMKTTSIKAGSTTTTKKKTTTRETTTSASPIKTTTTTTTRYTGGSNTTTNKYTKNTTTTTNKYTKTTTTTRTNQYGEIIYDPTTGNKKTTTTKTNRSQQTKTTQLTEEEKKQQKEKTTVNTFLISIGILVIVLYLIYKSIKKKQRLKNYNDDISDILDKYRGR